MSSDAERDALKRDEVGRLGWMALMLTPEMGPTRIARAMERLARGGAGLDLNETGHNSNGSARAFCGAERVFDASLTELEAAGMPAGAAQFVSDGRARAAAEKEAKQVAEAGGIFLTREDEAYPGRLLEIYDPPAVLWVRGDAKLLERPGIAVVGTRHPTPYGVGMAEMLSRDLANRRMTILSGMARGVDSAAHKGALDAGGKTVAVWGTGIDVVYPKENKKLAERIVASGGAIVSELPLGTFPAPQNFPLRNRILSGMSVGVLVVEGGEYSGTRITARCAMEQNREVFAVPGNVTNKSAWGPNTLIKQGAKLTATWEDIWEDLPTQIRLQLEEEMEAAGQIESKTGGSASLFEDEKPMPEAERVVLEKLRRDESVQLDTLIEGLEGTLGSAEIFTALFELELRGRVKQMPGKNYVRCF
jgi:DNA processing protein